MNTSPTCRVSHPQSARPVQRGEGRSGTTAPLPFPTRSGSAGTRKPSHRRGHPTPSPPTPLLAQGGGEGGCGKSFLGRGGVTASPHPRPLPRLTGARALASLLTASSASCPLGEDSGRDAGRRRALGEPRAVGNLFDSAQRRSADCLPRRPPDSAGEFPGPAPPQAPPLSWRGPRPLRRPRPNAPPLLSPGAGLQRPPPTARSGSGRGPRATA